MYNEKEAFREPKIKYYHTPNGETVAVCSYAGKKIKAVAKWNPEDEYDEEVGKREAKRKLLDKWFRAKIRRLNEINRWYDREIEILNGRREKIVKAISDTSDAYNSIYNSDK